MAGVGEQEHATVGGGERVFGYHAGPV